MLCKDEFLKKIIYVYTYNVIIYIFAKHTIKIKHMSNINKWALDVAHSEVQFKVKHLVISTVTGKFSVFGGSLEAGDQFENANIHFEVDVNSIDTGVADRDAHLKSDDFFNAEKYPKMIFKSTSFTQKEGSVWELKGDLTIRETTKNIALTVEYGGTTKDPWGNIKSGFELTGKINRKEYGLNWSAVTEAGGLVVAEEIKLFINVEFTKL
jgi:polyisoprenoid-binding protein YceI